MEVFGDPQGLQIYGTVFLILFVSSIFAWILNRSDIQKTKPVLVQEIIVRIKAWWLIALLFLAVLGLGVYATLALFLVISVLALREYACLTPTTISERRAIFYSFALIAPAQYYLIGIGWYGLYSIFIPVYAFLFIPTVLVLTGDCEEFLFRTARIQWGLMVCVYLLSHAPALLTLGINSYSGQQYKLLFYLVFVTEMSDVIQFVSGKLFGRRKIAPSISPNKTWGGFIGGILGAMILGALLYRITPFHVLQSAGMSFVIALAGFLGGLTMSAIKRDHGVKDYGTLIPGHGGVMDRIDSLCFSAPIFFHLTRYFFGQ